MSSSHWYPAYIGLGSNLREPVRQLDSALERLKVIPATRLVTWAPFFTNPPMGPQDQPAFVNTVAGLLTRLEPEALLEQLQAIESAMGRERDPEVHWGPRVIDLDLLVYADRRIEEPGLTVPHPGISERNFVLFPLLHVAHALDVPGQGPLRLLAQRSSRQGLELIPGTGPEQQQG